MQEQRPDAATIVCVGGTAETVRGVCARVKRSGHRAIAIITEVSPDCTLPLLSTLSPDAIIVSDDLPKCRGKDFTESLHQMYPDVRILRLSEGHDSPKRGAASLHSVGHSTSEPDVLAVLADVLRAEA
jgi:DNA-binding NarL/FixJ family response regulator